MNIQGLITGFMVAEIDMETRDVSQLSHCVSASDERRVKKHGEMDMRIKRSTWDKNITKLEWK